MITLFAYEWWCYFHKRQTQNGRPEKRRLNPNDNINHLFKFHRRHTVQQAVQSYYEQNPTASVLVGGPFETFAYDSFFTIKFNF